MSRPETARTVAETAIGPASDPYHFYCPDVPAVDHYLVALGRYIRCAVRISPRRVAAVRRDIDRLLDRRLALMMSVPTPRVREM
jgi:predicted ThiF/HesA family dinucleotide-utilizing enzyme